MTATPITFGFPVGNNLDFYTLWFIFLHPEALCNMEDPSSNIEMGRRASAMTTSIISAVLGTSSSGCTRSARAGDVAAKASLTGSATEDTACSVGADKAVEEIAAEEATEPSTQTGVGQTQPTGASRPRSSRTATAKTHGNKGASSFIRHGSTVYYSYQQQNRHSEEKAPVSTLKRRPPGGPTSPAKRRKVDVPTREPAASCQTFRWIHQLYSSKSQRRQFPGEGDFLVQFSQNPKKTRQTCEGEQRYGWHVGARLPQSGVPRTAPYGLDDVAK
ncbi:hypothetical protein ARMGADRAFT_1077944 [Armillaria gallica]|uniref:Uncharacterized protein n=1 Tax=Armillaria gallica TaxID=47427 RepID=A0A2H3DIZ1_ARMGA|nr:hypothetical protein ARMGADRAFT_1077944 [Armillaria gallica]